MESGNHYCRFLAYYDDLIEGYADVCSEAMVRNRDRFPFKQILGAACVSNQKQSIEVNVVDDQHIESYVFRLSESGIGVMQKKGFDQCACVRVWNVDKQYLEAVFCAPETFIQNPAKLNWEWLYNSRCLFSRRL